MSTSKKRLQLCENVNLSKKLKISADDDEEKLLELERSDRMKKSNRNQRHHAKVVAENVNLSKKLKLSADDDEEKLLELERSDKIKKSNINQRQYAKIVAAKTNDDSETVEKTKEKEVNRKIKGILRSQKYRDKKGALQANSVNDGFGDNRAYAVDDDGCGDSRASALVGDALGNNMASSLVSDGLDVAANEALNRDRLKLKKDLDDFTVLEECFVCGSEVSRQSSLMCCSALNFNVCITYRKAQLICAQQKIIHGLENYQVHHYCVAYFCLYIQCFVMD